MPEVAKYPFLSAPGEMAQLIQSRDWSKTPVGAPDTWPQALRTAIRLMLNSGHAMYIFWGPEHTCFYNDAYRQLIGPERHPSSLGQPGFSVWEEIWPIIGPQIDQVMHAGGATWHQNALVPITRHGRREDVYWTYSYSPIDDETAATGVGGVLVVCTDTTEAVKTEQEAQSGKAKFAALFEQSPNFMALLTGPQHVFEYCNPAYLQLIGHRDVIGKTVAEALPEAIEQGFVGLLDEVRRSGNAFKGFGTSIALQRDPTGPLETRVVDFVYQPIVDQLGEVTGIFVEGSDVSDQRDAEVALRHSEEQLRLATDSADVGMWDVDLVNDTLFWPARVKAMFGIAADQPVTMDDFYAGLHPDDYEHTTRSFMAAIDPNKRLVYDVEYRTVGRDGKLRWVAAKGKGVFDDQNRAVRVIGTAIDITERKNAERRREALIEFTDAIRDIETPEELAFSAAQILGHTLDACRAGFGTVNDKARVLTVRKDWVNGARSLAGEVPLLGYDEFLKIFAPAKSSQSAMFRPIHALPMWPNAGSLRQCAR